MSAKNKDPAIKVMLNDLISFKLSDSSWILNLNEENSNTINISKVHIQGEIYKTAGFSNEILIIDDGTGKAKVTRGPQVPGNFSWVKPGEVCSVVGTLVENGKLPHIAALKIAQISKGVMQNLWPLEVKELKNLWSGKILFTLPLE